VLGSAGPWPGGAGLQCSGAAAPAGTKRESLGQKQVPQAGVGPKCSILATQHSWGSSPHGQQQQKEHPCVTWL